MRSASVSLLARIVGALLQALLLVLLAQVLPLADFGAVGVGLAIGAIVMGVLGFGFPTAALRNADDEPFLNGLVRWTAWLAPAVGTLTLVLAVLITQGFFMACLAAACASIAELLNNVYQAVLFGQERLSRANLVMIARRAVPVAAILPLAVQPEFTPGSLLVVYSVGSLCSAVVCRLLVGKITADRVTFRHLLRTSRHYWQTGIWAMFQQLDVVIVAALIGTSASGYFAAAFRLASPVHILTSVLTSRLIPAVSRFKAAGGAGFGPGLRYLQLAVLYSSLIAAASPLLGQLAILILGPDFSGGYWIFVVLFVNSALSVVNQVLSSLIFAVGRGAEKVPLFTAAATALGLVVVLIGAVMGLTVVAALGTLAIQGVLLALLATGLAKGSRNG